MPAKFFGEFLQIQGLIDQKVLERVLEVQNSCNLKLGELAQHQGILTEQETLEINLRQQTEDKRFGDLAEELGLIKHEQLDELLELQKNQHKFFGDVLIDLGVLTQNELNDQLKKHQQHKRQASELLNNEFSHHPLGEYLTALIKTTNRLFLRTLLEQSQFSQLVSQTNVLRLASVTCQITLSGKKAVSVSMLTNPKSAAIIAHKFTMMPLEECDSEFSADAFGEFLNIIIGHLIDDTDINIPSKRSATVLNVNVTELYSNAKEILTAEIDTQIGEVFLIISS